MTQLHLKKGGPNVGGGAVTSGTVGIRIVVLNNANSFDKNKEQYILRAAIVNDVNSIRKCVEAAYQHYVERIGKPPKPMLDDYAKILLDHEVFVASQDISSENLDGILVLKASVDQFLLENIAVHPNAQGKGLGKQLMFLAEQRAIELRYDRIELYTHELMHENRELYRRLGYIKSKEVSEEGYQRIYFEKILV